MTSTIHTNMQSVRNHNVFEQNNVNMNKAMTNATTGMRINSVQDSPSNWAISEKMRERSNALNQAQQNIQNDTAMMKTAEGGMTKTANILSTLRERALAAADDSLTDADRQNIAKEMDKLLDQIDDIATDTRYNGKLLIAPLADGALDTGSADTTLTAAPTFTFQVGDDSTATISYTMQNMTLTGLGLSDIKTNINTAANADSASLYGALTAAQLQGDDARNLAETFKTAFDTVTSAIADLGALENRLGYTADNVATQLENLEASDSTIRDSDMAKEVSNYMKWSVLSQASQYMLAQSNQNAYGVLNLLQ